MAFPTRVGFLTGTISAATPYGWRTWLGANPTMHDPRRRKHKRNNGKSETADNLHQHLMTSPCGETAHEIMRGDC
ncbi:hypothetical protein SSBR45G_69560 [Bradyrhizobium sp. SSBR45G]|nr:hypothetical protein SSBR45G_69560 [Bradyrhizobium sp. SSBR45G]GLH89479.1 hypothetical protein SSBR45R_69400 [Bradyrhizobium sp. SSBR45R]